MDELANRKVLVVGLDASGLAACAFLNRRGARVSAIAASNEKTSQKGTAELKALAVSLVTEKNLKGFDLAVHSSQTSPRDSVLVALNAAAVPVISDLELAARGLFCLSIAIS